MENWAIVIGVNKYSRSQFNLKGAVNDALLMREWLLDPKGGNVPEGKLFLLLSEQSDSRIPNTRLASTKGIIESVQQMVSLSRGKGKRLYFYYSGHGLSKPGLVNEDAIIPADFDPALPNFGTLSIPSITQYFLSLNFLEQFFFFDACRNVPYREDFRVGYFSNPPGQPNPEIQQSIYFATTPGSYAIEQQEIGNECGAFTKSLLKGLKGEGKAKRYDSFTDEYYVKNDSLLEFISEEIKKTLGPKFEKFTPTITGERNRNLTLARFPSAEIPKVQLDILIEPPAIANNVEIKIIGGEPMAPQKVNTSPLVLKELLQTDYGVRAYSKEYLPKQRNYGIHLYSSQKLVIEMIKNPVSNSNASSLGNTDEEKEGKIVVFVKDKMGLLELIDNRGTILKQGHREISCNLKKGVYWARLILSERKRSEYPIYLSSGETKRVELKSNEDPQMSDQILEKYDFSPHSKSLEMSELVGPIINPNTTTVIALASRAETFRSAGESSFDKLGINDFHQLTRSFSGIQVIIGSELKDMNENEKFVKNMKIKIWKQTEGESENSSNLDLHQENENNPIQIRLKPLDVKGFGQGVEPLDSGSYWLKFESESKQPMIFSIVIIPEHISFFILQRNKNGKSRVFQYLPSSNPHKHLDEQKFEISNIRKMEIIQRYYESDILDYFYEDSLELAYEKWYDPMAGIVSGNLMFKNLGPNEQNSIDAISYNMSRHFPMISDSHVLRGKTLSMQGKEEESIQAFKDAINVGVPIFRENLESLQNVIAKHHLKREHNSDLIKKTFENRIRGALWTSFTP